LPLGLCRICDHSKFRDLAGRQLTDTGRGATTHRFVMSARSLASQSAFDGTALASLPAAQGGHSATFSAPVPYQ
jgi:hypothetical protein